MSGVWCIEAGAMNAAQGAIMRLLKSDVREETLIARDGGAGSVQSASNQSIMG